MGSKPKLVANSLQNLIQAFEQLLNSLAVDEVQADQDFKRVFRRMLREMGGVSEDGLAKAFKAVLPKAGLSSSLKFYDLRSSCTTELERSNVSHLVQRYVTGHTTKDILNDYVALDPVGEMKKYFHQIQPLLAAITERAKKLGMMSITTNTSGDMSSATSNASHLTVTFERNRISQQPACPESTSS